MDEDDYVIISPDYLNDHGTRKDNIESNNYDFINDNSNNDSNEKIVTEYLVPDIEELTNDSVSQDIESLSDNKEELTNDSIIKDIESLSDNKYELTDNSLNECNEHKIHLEDYTTSPIKEEKIPIFNNLFDMIINYFNNFAQYISDKVNDFLNTLPISDDFKKFFNINHIK